VHHSITGFPDQFQELTNHQRDPDKSSGWLGRIVMDAFAFEFMGLVMVALCLAVLAVPSGRRPSRRVRHY
jgi:hypothetical protein